METGTVRDAAAEGEETAADQVSVHVVMVRRRLSVR
jgi:hypothetical protein